MFRAFNTEDYVRASNNDGYEVVGSSCMGKISVQFISPVSPGLNSLYWPAAAAAAADLDLNVIGKCAAHLAPSK